MGNVDGVFINNWVQGVGDNKGTFSIDRPWPSDNGFFFEISKGAICAGNVFVNCDHGIWVLNSSDVHIYNNTFVNSTACIARNGRSAQGDHFGWHPSTGPDVDERDGHVFVNNLMAGDESFNRLLLYVWQPPELCDRLNASQLKRLDHNVYVRGSSLPDHPIILWSPVQNTDCRSTFHSLEEFQKMNPDFSPHSLYFRDYQGPLFKSSELGHYQLLPTFPGTDTGIKLPSEIGRLLSQSRRRIGAY